MLLTGFKSPLFSHIRTFARGRIPGQLIIQLTDHCNASCPQCGMRRSAPFRRSLLTVDEGKKIIDHAAASGISSLSFTGGEPFLFADQLITLIRHAGEAGIRYIRTGTNGFLFMNPDRPDFHERVSSLAERLASTSIYTFWISIDSSVPELHEKMRGLPGVVKGIERALPIFHAHGIYPSANLGITRNIAGLPDGGTLSVTFSESACRKGFDAFFRSVMDLGFTIVNACYPMSVDESSGDSLSPVYQATATSDLVRFSSSERITLFRALRETIPQFRSRIRIFSPLSSLLAIERQYTGNADSCRPCRGGSDFFFINAASGDTYPCGYRGSENLGKFWDLDIKTAPIAASCKECDWECFRDPSELMGPFHEFFTAPAGLIKKFANDRAFARLWLSDLRYYRACDLFNGRIPPDYRKLDSFGQNRIPA